MRILIVLKNGFRYQGDLISENETHLTINDIKLGNLTISKDTIAVRSINGCGKYEYWRKVFWADLGTIFE